MCYYYVIIAKTSFAKPPFVNSRMVGVPGGFTVFVSVWGLGLPRVRESHHGSTLNSLKSCEGKSAQTASTKYSVHLVSITRFPSFRTQTLENLSHYLWTKNRFLSNPDPGKNLVSGNLVMETGCTRSFEVQHF